MTDKALADILARTYAHRVTAFRPLAEGEERLCEAAPCALSRSEHTSAPTPPSLSAAWPEALYRLTLYTRPELAFRLGDRVEVTDEGGSVWMGRTSDSFRYDSHCVTVVKTEGETLTFTVELCVPLAQPEKPAMEPPGRMATLNLDI